MAKKSLIHLLCMISPIILFSCTKTIIEDPADKFVGSYTYNETYYATWGSTSSSFSDNGGFTITKLSSDRVKISNPWNTSATVLDNQLSIDPVTQGDQSGYVNYTFTSAYLNGDMLTISYQGMGSLKYSDGHDYPYMCQGSISARKNVLE